MGENRVLRVIKKISTDFIQDIKYYSVKLALLRTAETIFQTLRLKNVSRYFQTQKTAYVLEYLKIHYGYVFTKLVNVENKGDRETRIFDKPIWICWLDGIENAPLLVQKCVSSVKKNAGNHPVNIITKDNYTEFVTLPEYIIEKKEKGLIGAAHFSDVLRVCLLAQYGGLWLDATIYCKGNLPDKYFENDFFTCKSEPGVIGCISKNQWTTFCLGGTPNCIIFQVLRNFFFEYWKMEDCAIDYLFFDDAIEVARENLSEINYLIKAVPYNNTERDCLITRFADPWEKGCVDDLFAGNTILFKLGYREKQFLNEFTNKGEPTVYAAFLKDFEMGGTI
ncbi:capsular polysaccharide synthesis protein [Sharpea azabuensis]|uniref:capsular polysaccharide synthesis protein n=1 Tax=Sharpea azabuensis TaxID=322505 RepID=UPI00156C30AB|nr:capsular polysaccharide synthesis protein [Sharpea azabuensis]